jgi:hypothetical protein
MLYFQDNNHVITTDRDGRMIETCREYNLHSYVTDDRGTESLYVKLTDNQGNTYDVSALIVDNICTSFAMRAYDGALQVFEGDVAFQLIDGGEEEGSHVFAQPCNAIDEDTRIKLDVTERVTTYGINNQDQYL